MGLPSPPGRLVDIGTHRLHIRCEGAGAPAVVFDAALGGSSLSWILVQREVARLTRACAYDRGGFGWSDAGPMPRTAGRLADELHQLLHRAQVPPPYVLVGHSYGGLVVRLYAARHPKEIAGLVFIEPAIPDEWADPSEEQRARIDRGTRLCAYGSRAARTGLARLVSALVALDALTPARGLVRLLSRGGLRRADEEILAPIWKLPPEARRLLRQLWVQPKFFDALGSQIASVCESAADVLGAGPASYGDLPLVVMTADSAAAPRVRADAALARASLRGRHVRVAGAGHWIPLDAPHAVVDAISSMLRDIRSSTPVPRGP